MVKRKKFQNCDNSEEKCEENWKTSEPVPPTTNAISKNNVAVQLGESKDSISNTLTRSKTALQLQQQSNNHASEQLVDVQTAVTANESKSLCETESINNTVSNSVSAKNAKPVVRANKKSKRDLNGQPPVIQNSKKRKSVRKPRRAWEVWSKVDIDMFFEGICEYGKDFEKIQAFLVQRTKKRGFQFGFTKNKDQVRHFYYRSLQKLTKHIILEDSVNKLAQEVCIMVNYAELRRKLGRGLSDRNEQKLNEFIQKLNELIHNGNTTVKLKGRKIRIKTPICRALKKLNNAEDSKFEDADKLPKLPSHIKVMLCPRNNATWSKIQTLSMNPRVKFRLSLQKRFSDVIEFLQKRWKPYRLKVKDKLLSGLPPSQQNLTVKPSEHSEVLKITPRLMPETDIHPVTITQTDTSNQNITLKDFISSPETVKQKKALKPKQMTEGKDMSSSVLQPLDEPNVECEENFGDSKSDKPDFPTKEVSETFSDMINSVANNALKEEPSSNGISINDIDSSATSKFDLDLDAAKEGFTAVSAKSLTVGQLYLMMNKPDSLILDYELVPAEDSKQPFTKPLTYMLKELVHAASVSFSDLSKVKQNATSSGNVISCCCGHLCQQSTKNMHKTSAVSKSPARGGGTSNRVLASKPQVAAKAADSEDQSEVQNVQQDSFLKPTAVAPRSTAQASSRIMNFCEQVVGIGPLRRPAVRVRQLKKPNVNKRALLPKAVTAQHTTPMVTVQLMPSANLPPVNQGDCIQKVATPNSPQEVLRLVPGSKIVDISSAGAMNNIAMPVSETDVQTNKSPASDGSTEKSCQSAINPGDILSTITASIINDSDGNKQLKNDPIISQAQNKEILPVVNTPKSLVEISSQSPPRISIPDSHISEQTTNLPHNLTALLNTTLQNNTSSFIRDTQPNHTLSLINSNDDETRFDAAKPQLSPTSNLEGGQNANSSSPEQLAHPTSPGLSTNWLDSENSEYSISTLLGTLESPTKSGTAVLQSLHNSVSLHSDSSSLDGIGRLAPDVDTQLQCLMNENSIDYVSKFADLAAHIASSDHKK